MWTVAQLAADLAAGRTTSRRLTEQALARIADPAGEGPRAFMKVYAESALAEADFSDRLRKGGVRRSPVDGLPVSLKDLFDVAGDVTRAGSKALSRKAETDAPAVARLRAAGAVFVGRTNMVEFAFGTTGINPHYGTPKNPWDRPTGRIPGGSSSGAAVAQADGMCVMALGTDTRGSVRIPAALCGVTGFKPTARRVPREGAFPLSYTRLDRAACQFGRLLRDLRRAARRRDAGTVARAAGQGAEVPPAAERSARGPRARG
jgi:aspartyl-tRNA(Asn)/glutamyl-tRNA(Gln) amidotransferase subunit A